MVDRRRRSPEGGSPRVPLGALFLAALAGACAEAPGEVPPPSFLVILTDDQGWGATSVQLDPDEPASRSDFVRTPRLEALAAEGLRFSRAYAAHPNCSPSRAALLTGLSPARLGFTDVPRPALKYEAFYRGNRLLPPDGVRELDPERVTLPELLKAARPAYRTAHFGKWHLGAGGPEAHGFDEGDGATGNEQGSDGQRFSADPKRCVSVTARAVDFLERQAAAGRPFFLQVSHYATHLSYQSRRATWARVQGWPPGERHRDRGFAAMSYDLDRSVGELMDALERLGLARDTWVVFTSDNGTYPTSNPANVNGPLRGGKATVYEGGVRVPMIVRGPGVQPGEARSEPVIGTDLLPTVAELAGIAERPPELDGVSLVPLLLGGEQSLQRPAEGFCFHFPHYQHRKVVTPRSAWLDLASGEKLHRVWETGALELFDLEADPTERRDLAAERPERVRVLAAELEAWLAAAGAPRPEPNPSFDPERDPALWIPPDELEPYD